MQDGAGGILMQLIPAALGISLDTFAAALAFGARTQRGDRERMAITFAIVGGAVPVFGVVVGRAARGWIGGFSGFFSAAILLGLGIWLLAQARSSAGSQEHLPDLERPGRRPDGKGVRFRPPITGLVLIALALSPDNILVGVGVGLYQGGSLLLGLMAGFFIYLSTHIGLHLGAMGGLRFGSWALAIGGGLLVALAVVLGVSAAFEVGEVVGGSSL